VTGTRVADAREFARTVDPRSRAGVELEGLVSSGSIPIDRTETWHAVASVLLATRDGHVLLALNKVGWGTVGGHVEEADPDLRAAAAREAEEELGLILDPADLAPLLFLPDTMVIRPGHAHWDFCYLTVVDEQVPVTAADDVSDAQWFPLDALPEVNDHMRQHLDALRSLLAR
jgi:8-oxo-dGTP pyrophosphatase MutT (NUDIX family)